MDSDVEAAVQRLIDKDEIIDLVHRWIAATVLRLGVPVVSNDTIFRPGWSWRPCPVPRQIRNAAPCHVTTRLVRVFAHRSAS